MAGEIMPDVLDSFLDSSKPATDFGLAGPAAAPQKPTSPAAPTANVDAFLDSNKPWSDFQSPTTSNVREFSAALTRGFLSDLPSMVGQSLQFLGASPEQEAEKNPAQAQIVGGKTVPLDGRGSPLWELGQAIRNVGDAYGNLPSLKAHPEGHGAVSQAVTQAAEMIGPSSAALGLNLIPGMQGLAGLEVASAAGAGLFGLSQAQDTWERAKQAGLSDQDAMKAARLTGSIEAGGEFLGTMFLGKLFGITGNTIAKVAGKSPIAGVFESFKNPHILGEFTKTLAETYGVEIGTEMGQNYGERKVEQEAGIPGATPWESAKQAVGPTFFMTSIMAPFGLMGHRHLARTRSVIAQTVADPRANIQTRIAGINLITAALKEVDPKFAEGWRGYAAGQVSQGKAVALDPDYRVNMGLRDIGSADTATDATKAAQDALSYEGGIDYDPTKVIEAATSPDLSLVDENAPPPQQEGIPYESQPPTALDAQLESFYQAEHRTGVYPGGVPYTRTEAPRTTNQPLTLAGQEGAPEAGVAYTPPEEHRQGVIARQASNIERQQAEYSRTSRLPPNLSDPRLARDQFRQGLQDMAHQLVKGGGIALTGGQFTDTETDARFMKPVDQLEPVKRTKSQNPDWFQTLAGEENGLTVEKFKHAVDKALSGKKLGIPEARWVTAGLDIITGERTDPRNIEYVQQQIQQARNLRMEAAKGLPPLEAYQHEIDHAGEIYQEKEYDPEWDGPTRSLFELLEQAKEVDKQKAYDLYESGGSDIQIAHRLAQLIIQGKGHEQETAKAQTESGTAVGTEAVTPERPAGSQAATAAAGPGTVAPEGDLFGNKTEVAQALHNHELEIQKKLGAGQEHVPAESAGDLFDQNREKQQELLAKVETGAHAAATSPLNEHPEPTQAQKEAGAYQKGHITNLHGLNITIENPVGSVRSSKPGTKPVWHTTMKDHYGYILGTRGADDHGGKTPEHVDVFIGPHPDSNEAYVIDQVDPKTGKFDEHKVMLGYQTKGMAKLAYKRNYAKGWKGMGHITPTSIEHFKWWLENGDMKKAFADQRIPKSSPTRPEAKYLGKDATWWNDLTKNRRRHIALKAGYSNERAEAFTQNEWKAFTDADRKNLLTSATTVKELTPEAAKANYERGISRAKEAVEANGGKWSDIKILAQEDEISAARKKYGIPNSISEKENPIATGRGGSLFIDDETGKAVAYAPSLEVMRALNKEKGDLAAIPTETSEEAGTKWDALDKQARAALAMKAGYEESTAKAIAMADWEDLTKAPRGDIANVLRGEAPAAERGMQQSPEQTVWWDNLAPAEREAVVIKAGWKTAKGDVNPTGRAIIKQDWKALTGMTQHTILRFAGKVKNEIKEDGVQYGLFDDGGLPERPEGTGRPRGVFYVRESTDATSLKSKTRVSNVQRGFYRSAYTKATTAEEVAHIISPLRKNAQENLIAVVTDKNDHVLGVLEHGIGGLSQANVSRTVLVQHIHSIDGAANAWIAHNHPSGNVDQSIPDKQITNSINNALKGTGVDLKSMLVVAPNSRSFSSYDPRTHQMYYGQIPADVRTKEVPIYRREYRTIANVKQDVQLSSPKRTMALSNMLPESGMILLDNQHHVVGWLDITPDEMNSLRTEESGKGISSVIRAVNEVNAAAVILKSPQLRPLMNLNGALKDTQPELRVLDAITNGTGGNWVSMAERSNSLPAEAYWHSQEKGEPLSRPAPQLSVLHNITPENLLYADKIGGLPAPSLAVVKEGMGVEKMGRITLIGRSELGNPKTVPIYDADAYTSTYPYPEYNKVKYEKARGFGDELGEWSKKYGGDSDYEIMYNMTEDPAPDRVIQLFENSNAGKAMFLKQVHNIDVKPVIRDKPLPFEWMDDHQFVKAAGDIWTLINNYPYDKQSNLPEFEAFTTAAREAIDRYLVKHPAEVKAFTDAGYTHDEILELKGTVFGVDGSWVTGKRIIPFSVLNKIANAMGDIGQREVDVYATRDRLDGKMKKSYAVQFHDWATNKIMAYYGKPFLRIGGKRVAYSLPNMVEKMTHGGVQAKEKGLVFGEGKARAVAANQMGDMIEMRTRAEYQIQPEQDVEAQREEVKQLMSDWRQNLLNHHTSATDFNGTWDTLDASMRAMAKWAKTRLRRGSRHAMRKALRSEGFKNLDNAIIDEGVAAGERFLETPVPYFEAKPHRAVGLDEFAGAVIPSEAPKEVRDVLDKHGVPYRTYRGGSDRQVKVVDEFRRKLSRQGEDVLFSRERVEATPQFKGWFKQSQVVDEQGKPQQVYRGDFRDIGETMRIRGEGDVNDTSGGIYFTSDPTVASGYAGKYSFEEDEDALHHPNKIIQVKSGSRVEGLIDAGKRLTREQQQKFVDIVKGYGYDPVSGEEGFKSLNPGVDPYIGDQTWQDYLKRNHGNYVTASFDVLVQSGTMTVDDYLGALRQFNVFDKVYSLPGEEGAPTVTPVYLSIQHPLDMQAMTREKAKTLLKELPSEKDSILRYALTNFAKGIESEPSTVVGLTPQDRNVLETMGYDGIKDEGGRMTGGAKHDVWIAFYPNQIKSSIGNRGYFNENDDRFTYNLYAHARTGFSKAKAEEAIAPLKAAVNEKTGMNLRVINTDEIPDEAKAGIAGDGYTKGFAHGNDIYLVADVHANKNDIIKTFIHEVKGHFGVNGIIDMAGGWNTVIDDFHQMKAGGGKQFTSILNEVERRYDNLSPDQQVLEFVAVAAERRITEGVVGKFLRKVRELFFKGLKTLGLQRAMPMTYIDSLLSQSEMYLKNAKQIFNKESPDAMNYNMEKEKGDSFASTAIKQLALNSDFFLYPDSSSKQLHDIAQDIDPGIVVTEHNINNRHVWQLRIPISGGMYSEPVQIEQMRDGTVFINAALLEKGQRGNLVYHVVATYAHNNRLKFVADPLGLSHDAMIRRTENLLASALRYGTTRHIEPHQEQNIPWKEGKDAYNINSLIRAAITPVRLQLPRINEIVYDFARKTFWDTKNEQPFTDADFVRLASTEGARAVRAGLRTLKRAALLNTLLRPGGQSRSSILAKVIRQRHTELDPALRGISYSQEKFDPPYVRRLKERQAQESAAENGGDPPTPPPHQFSMPNGDESVELLRHATRLLTPLRYQLQDRFIDLKHIQQDLGVTPGADAYLAESVWQGRAGARLQDFERDRVEPLLRKAAEAGLDLDQVDNWLHARHAQEANDYLKEINPNRENNDALSGMSDEDAQKILDAYKDNEALQEVGKMVDQINAERVKLLVDNHLITQDTANAWWGTYKHYVPLKRDETNALLPPRGQGFNIRGKESRLRLGSHKPVTNILTNVIAQYESSQIRAEKNRVGQALLDFVNQHPDPEWWEVDKAQKVGTLVGGEAKWFNDPREPQNALHVKVDGEIHSILFNESNPPAMRILRAMKNLDQSEMGWLVRTMLTVNRMLAMLNTSLSPEFVISNFARDLQTAAYNMSDTQLKNAEMEVIKMVPGALKGLREVMRKGEMNSEWAQWAERFRLAGGQTGWIDHYKNVFARAESLEKQFNRIKRGSDKNALMAVKKFVEDYNTIVENGIRLAAFRKAVENGVPEIDAAGISKNLTVNFNRKGMAGQTMNALYLFYNASIQGSVRMLEAMIHSSKGRKLAVGTIGVAVLLDILNRSLAGDDDDGENRYDALPSYVKSHYWLIMGDKQPVFKFMLPWGYNVLHVIGQQIGEALTGKRFNSATSAARIGSAMLDAFNPVGHSTFLQTLSPTLLDPAVQIAENKTWTGAPLKPESDPYGPPKPEYEQFWSSSRQVSRAITKWLNDHSGGDSVRPGKLNFSPEWLDLMIDTFTGSAGRVVGDTVNIANEAVTGQKIKVNSIPMIRRLYGFDDTNMLKSRYFEWSQDVRYNEEQVKNLRGAEREKAIQSPLHKLTGLEKVTRSALRQIRKAAKQAQQDGNDMRAQKLQKTERRLMARFNRRYATLILDKGS